MAGKILLKMRIVLLALLLVAAAQAFAPTTGQTLQACRFASVASGYFIGGLAENFRETLHPYMHMLASTSAPVPCTV